MSSVMNLLVFPLNLFHLIFRIGKFSIEDSVIEISTKFRLNNMVDFGRLMPPEDPLMGKTYFPRSVFHKLLRPEAIVYLPNPVCSDAFTRYDVIICDINLLQKPFFHLAKID